jgi:sucrose phosphorylase
MGVNNPGTYTEEKPPQLSRIPYDQDPDFTRPFLEIPDDAKERMCSRLAMLYGESVAKEWMPDSLIRELEKDYDPEERFTEKDMVLITYGDVIKGEKGNTLEALHRFIQRYNPGTINTIHLLPFFPYSSDRGFSVVDFKAVDPNMGTWECILDMGVDYDLMFDGVLNHCSSRSEMFRQFLRGNPHYKDFFIAYDSPEDLTLDQRSKIFRPRTSDILTKFDSIDGPKYVWTTFSHDQIDFNFRNPDVLMRVIEALLFYVRRGADIIRLDAVTYLWSEPGTDCVHLPETHAAVKLLRDVMDVVAPGVALITETNVPHEQNISYFGNGYDEAHMVYNFALPPLVLYTYYAQDATAISKWAQGLEIDSKAATFFNMLDTHDGVGVMGVKGILAKEEIDLIIQRAKENGAYISYKTTESMTEEPYEINTTWWSAMNGDHSDEDITFQVKRYVAFRSLALVIKGVPGVYTHGVMAILNDHDKVQQTGVKRDVNRGTIDPARLAKDLEDPQSKRSLMRRINGKIGMHRVRHRAFHPQGDQQVLMVSPDVFAVFRISPEGDQHILTLTNVTDRVSSIEVFLSDLGVKETEWHDLLSDGAWEARDGKLSIDLEPYDVVWMMPNTEWVKS